MAKYYVRIEKFLLKFKQKIMNKQRKMLWLSLQQTNEELLLNKVVEVKEIL